MWRTAIPVSYTHLDVYKRQVERLADHIISRFGEDKEPGIPGHQEVEIGLMKLYRATGKEKYKKMARYFLEERGKNPDYFYEEKKKRGWQHWGCLLYTSGEMAVI